MRVFIVAIILTVALILAGHSSSAPLYTTYPKIDAVASWLAMRKVEVRCLNTSESTSDIYISSGAEAYVEGIYDKNGVWRPRNYAVFKNGLCEELLQPRRVSELAWAILVLTHESGHLRGWSWSANEAKTQCWAMRHFRYTANRLGYSTEGTNLLLAYALYWHKNMPAVYRGISCELPKVDPISIYPVFS